MKKPLITGITDQDGSCLAELRLDNGDKVHGIKGGASWFNTLQPLPGRLSWWVYPYALQVTSLFVN